MLLRTRNGFHSAAREQQGTERDKVTRNPTTDFSESTLLHTDGGSDRSA